MPQNNVITKLERLIRAGFTALGSRIPVERDGESLAVRNLLIEVEKGRLNAYDSQNESHVPAFSVPADGLTSFASKVVITVVTRRAVRAIEDCHEKMLEIEEGRTEGAEG